MNDVLFAIVEVVFTASLIIVMRYVVPFLKQKLMEAVGRNVYAEIEKQVRSVEQIFKGKGMGSAKKAEVISRIRSWAHRHNIEITEEQIIELIESAVFVLNNKEE